MWNTEQMTDNITCEYDMNEKKFNCFKIPYVESELIF